MSNYFNNVDVIQLLLKWKRHLILTVVISTVLAVIFTMPFFIKPKFKSKAILYPVNLASFGQESTVEQTIQIMQSDEIQFKIAERFDLMKHYRIDADSPYPQTELLKEIEENSSFNKTEFESVEIEVLDENPKIAAEIVNAYIELFNEKERSLQRSKTLEVVRIIKDQFDKKKIEMDSVEAKLREFRIRYGMLNYEAQSKVVAKNLFRSKKKADPDDMAKVLAMKKNLEERGGEFIALGEHAYRNRAMYNDLKVSYESALKDLNKELTHANIITAPYPADKKTYPVRWLIILIVAGSSFLFSMVVIYLMENAKLQNSKTE